MSRRLLIGVSVIASTGLAYLYAEHRRLLREYPTFPIPSCLYIDARTDGPHTSPAWAQCDAGDIWVVKVPPNLDPRNYTTSTDDLGAEWAKTFMGTWPLRLEGGIIGFLRTLGLRPFAREVDVVERDRETIENLEPLRRGDTFVNGTFIVETCDQESFRSTLPSPSLPSSSPAATASTELPLNSRRTILRWGSIRPNQPGKLVVRGGYHDLTVLPSSQLFPFAITASGAPRGSEKADNLYFVFASHLFYSRSTSGARVDGSEAGKKEPKEGTTALARSSSLINRSLIWFHQAYSRVLVDLAFRHLNAAHP